MDQVTAARIAEFERAAMRDELSLEDRIERARLRSLERAPKVTEPMLKLDTIPGAITNLVTVTTEELHDLVYAACGVYWRELSGVPLEQGRRHSARIADHALMLLGGHPDYLHQGLDPRAAT